MKRRNQTIRVRSFYVILIKKQQQYFKKYFSNKINFDIIYKNVLQLILV